MANDSNSRAHAWVRGYVVHQQIGYTTSMHIEFTKASIPGEIRKLRAFDRRVFKKADLFTSEEWREYESFWMLLNGTRVGCCAFQRNVDFQEDIRKDGRNPPKMGSLYISTTGILPGFLSKGLGQLLKSWEIAYAKNQGFRRIVTNTRERNTKMISLNEKFGFKTIRKTPTYYSDPTEATVVMELRV